MFNLVHFLEKRSGFAGKDHEKEKTVTLFEKLSELTTPTQSVPGYAPQQQLGVLSNVVGAPAKMPDPITNIPTETQGPLSSPVKPSISSVNSQGAMSQPGIAGKSMKTNSAEQSHISKLPMNRLAKPMSKMARNTGIVDIDGEIYVNGSDVELLGKLGFECSASEYIELKKTSEALDLYSYIEKVAGIPKEVAKLVDSGQAFSGEYLKDMGYSVPKGYEVKGDLCCPVEKTEQSFQQTEKEEKESPEKTASASKPGLWANIHAKKARGEKAAKPGDEDYPDKEQWDKLSKEGAASPAWQRSEGKNPEGGLNAKGRASYKRETGGTLKAPVTESEPKGERAKRQNSFCSRMCGMKSKNTGSAAQSNPGSRINKSLRKWNCKCGEDHSTMFEKLACSVKEAKGRCWEGYEPVPGKEAYSEDSCRPKGEKKKEVKKEAEMNTSSAPTLSTGGPLAINTEPINIPTENLAQQNPPSVGTIAKEVGMGSPDLIPVASSMITKKVAPFVPAKLRDKLIRFNAASNIGTGEVNAAQRTENNDTTGKWIDRVGAVGGAMSALPDPRVAVPGAILSGGALAVNTGRDIQRAREKYSGPPILGGNKPAFPSFPNPVNSVPQPQSQQPQLLTKNSAADHPLKSSNIKAVGYDKSNKTLEVAFHSGGEYKYSDVPKSLFDRIKKVKSPGKFFNKHVKKKELPYEKIEKEAGFRLPKGKIPLNHPELLPGVAEHLAKQPFNRAENAFAQGRMSKALRDSILSGRRAEEVKPAFEKMLEHIRSIQ